MIAPVLRGGFVRKNFVISHIIEIHIISSGSADGRRRSAQIADERRDCDIHHVIPKPSSIGPAAGNSTIAKPSLHSTCEGVVAEDAKPREPWIVRVCSRAGAVTGHAGRAQGPGVARAAQERSPGRQGRFPGVPVRAPGRRAPHRAGRLPRGRAAQSRPPEPATRGRVSGGVHRADPAQVEEAVLVAHEEPECSPRHVDEPARRRLAVVDVNGHVMPY